MSRVSDMIKDVFKMDKVLADMQAKHTTVSTDLYAAIKEVAELKYRIVELELRLSNLEAMVKTLTEKGD